MFMFLKFKVCLIYIRSTITVRSPAIRIFWQVSFNHSLLDYVHIYMNQNSIMCTTHGLVMAYQYFLSFFQPFVTLIIHFLSVILPNLFQRYTCISMRSDVKRGNCTLSHTNDCHSTQTFLIYVSIIYKNNNSLSYTQTLRENTTL